MHFSRDEHITALHDALLEELLQRFADRLLIAVRVCVSFTRGTLYLSSTLHSMTARAHCTQQVRCVDETIAGTHRSLNSGLCLTSRTLHWHSLPSSYAYNQTNHPSAQPELRYFSSC